MWDEKEEIEGMKKRGIGVGIAILVMFVAFSMGGCVLVNMYSGYNAHIYKTCAYDVLCFGGTARRVLSIFIPMLVILSIILENEYKLSVNIVVREKGRDYILWKNMYDVIIRSLVLVIANALICLAVGYISTGKFYNFNSGDSLYYIVNSKVEYNAVLITIKIIFLSFMEVITRCFIGIMLMQFINKTWLVVLLEILFVICIPNKFIHIAKDISKSVDYGVFSSTRLYNISLSCMFVVASAVILAAIFLSKKRDFIGLE